MEWIDSELAGLRAQGFTGRVWLNLNQGGLALLGVTPRPDDPVEHQWWEGVRQQRVAV